jgi:hypothetical protein
MWPLIFASQQQERADLPDELEVLAFASLNVLLSSIEREFGVEATMKPAERMRVSYA